MLHIPVIYFIAITSTAPTTVCVKSLPVITPCYFSNMNKLIKQFYVLMSCFTNQDNFSRFTFSAIPNQRLWKNTESICGKLCPPSHKSSCWNHWTWILGRNTCRWPLFRRSDCVTFFVTLLSAEGIRKTAVSPAAWIKFCHLRVAESNMLTILVCQATETQSHTIHRPWQLIVSEQQQESKELPGWEAQGDSEHLSFSLDIQLNVYMLLFSRGFT